MEFCIRDTGFLARVRNYLKLCIRYVFKSLLLRQMCIKTCSQQPTIKSWDTELHAWPVIQAAAHPCLLSLVNDALAAGEQLKKAKKNRRSQRKRTSMQLSLNQVVPSCMVVYSGKLIKPERRMEAQKSEHLHPGKCTQKFSLAKGRAEGQCNGQSQRNAPLPLITPLNKLKKSGEKQQTDTTVLEENTFSFFLQLSVVKYALL